MCATGMAHLTRRATAASRWSSGWVINSAGGSGCAAASISTRCFTRPKAARSRFTMAIGGCASAWACRSTADGQGARSVKNITRRRFVTVTASTAAGLALARTPASAAAPIRIGLIGCGGRGTAAVKDCLTSSDGVQLVALGDLFPDHLAKCRENLAGVATVDDRHAFTGFDAYQKVLRRKTNL